MIDLLIFDMDGVLVDVSQSYRKAIQQTIGLYLEQCLGLKPIRVSNEEITLFKSAGGFNNDWDLTSGFLRYLLSEFKLPSLSRKRNVSSLDQAVLFLRQRLSSVGRPNPFRPSRESLLSFLDAVKASGGGPKGIRSALKGRFEGWVYDSGDLDRENLVKRIFQELYLGERFPSHYGLPRRFYRGEGLYLRERLLIGRRILSALRKRGLKLGIASGRPRREAELALKRFRIASYFDAVVTLDECQEEERRIYRETGRRVQRTKPHPYSLLKVIEEIGISRPRCGYVGDVVDDMRAARAAGKSSQMTAIGFLRGRHHRPTLREALLKAGADLLIESPEELLRRI
ncbi:MAG: HAD family hydrolase [Desulfobacterota bacterium]|nr:HAD family hydrolase [Thermodesulfobacteriota bacterium]